MTATTHQPTGTVWEVFQAFLILGLTSFGGPVAHLGYFRTEFVVRRHWLTEQDYTDLVALCQFLPGPASSQVGFALGLQRAGYAGALAAWVAFTMPSALLLFAFALGAVAWQGELAGAVTEGLKLVAVAIVAHAVWGMARNLCPDRSRAGIALGAFIITVAGGQLLGPPALVLAIVAGMLLAAWLRPGDWQAPAPTDFQIPVGKTGASLALVSFVVLLLGLPLLSWLNGQGLFALMDSFYRAGALVFGGGHVVLPLLDAETVQQGWLERDSFLAGYGAAQAIPGPLFTFAAYLGALAGQGPVVGAMLALLMIFLPGLLLLVGVLPAWQQVRQQARVQYVLRGAGAAVVGILGAALYDPVWTSAVVDGPSLLLAVTGFLLLQVWHWRAWAVVLLLVFARVLLALLIG